MARRLDTCSYARARRQSENTMTASLLLLIAFQQQDRSTSCVLNADLSPPTFFLIRKKLNQIRDRRLCRFIGVLLIQADRGNYSRYSNSLCIQNRPTMVINSARNQQADHKTYQQDRGVRGRFWSSFQDDDRTPPT
jgi:hypothetical protein